MRIKLARSTLLAVAAIVTTGAGPAREAASHAWKNAENRALVARKSTKERWFLEAAEQRVVSPFLAFGNPPPGRMTRNAISFCNKGTDHLKPGDEPQRARYLAGISLNEPQWAWEGHRQKGSR